MSTLDDLAEALAIDVLKAVDKLGDEQLIQDVATVLAATSTPTEEAFLSAVRVRQAERRGRQFLTTYIERAIKKRNAKGSS
ncbi:MAG: hypothetical protein KUG70_10500 [Rhodobacteraceae bacterium]|nr:hypothetical protein [Paracoccaceae bacterium]